MSSNSDRSDESGRDSIPARFGEWLLLHGNRGAVAALTSAVVFAIVASVEIVQATPLRNQQPIFYVFSGMISGNLTIITVVVSINQLLLSREIDTPNELRSQVEGTIEYREDVEVETDQIAPVEPLGFLRLLIESTRQVAQRLGGDAFAELSGDAADDVEAVVAKVIGHIDGVDDLLRKANPSTFTVLSATLTTNYANDINRLRRIRARYGDELPPDAAEAIDDLIEQLQNIDVARQYFKGIYLQQELAALSRYLFYVGIPSLVIVAATLFALTGDSAASIPRLAPLLLSVSITAGFVPLIVLFAFILRTATVTRRTVATVPFTSPVQEQ